MAIVGLMVNMGRKNQWVWLKN